MTLRAVGLRILMSVAVAGLLCLLTLPLMALVVRLSPAAVWHRLGQPGALAALRLSLVTSAAATLAVVLLGLPVAYLLATRDFPGKRLVQAIVELPIVLPPTVAGVGLLLAFGRTGLAGGALHAVGITLPFTTLAVVVAQSFVATPFFISAGLAGLASVEPRYLEVAATLRAGPAYRFFRVMLPLALPSILAGAAMSWARALGEFGATITFAGSLAGRTETMPLAVYDALETDIDSAVALSIVLLVLSFGVLVCLRYAPWAAGIGGSRRAQRPGR